MQTKQDNQQWQTTHFEFEHFNFSTVLEKERTPSNVRGIFGWIAEYLYR